MTLRVEKARIEEAVGGNGPGDEWGTRIAKLIPAEALGLYGSAVALIRTDSAEAHTIALWAVVAVCCGLTVLIRYRATLDPTTKQPQWTAIAISLISFILWLDCAWRAHLADRAARGGRVRRSLGRADVGDDRTLYLQGLAGLGDR